MEYEYATALSIAAKKLHDSWILQWDSKSLDFYQKQLNAYGMHILLSESHTHITHILIGICI